MSSLLERTLAEIPSLASQGITQTVQTRWDSLTKPRGSLGLLEKAIVQLALIQNTTTPSLDRRALFLFCGDHGITAENVSPYPSVVTREMVKNFVCGRAAINVLCRQLSIEPHIIDAGVAGPPLDGVLNHRIASGTANFLHQPAMSFAQARQSVESGIAIAHKAALHFDIAAVGEMGIGNSTSASVLLCAFTGLSPNQSAGRGAGLDNAGLLHKTDILSKALAARQFDPKDPLTVISAFAGFEIAMLAGFLLGAAATRLPVVIDGFITGAALLIARAFYPAIHQHVFFAHQSAEHGHAALLSTLGVKPLLHLEMRLGEGTGAALAIGLLSSALLLYREMSTFTEASVSDQMPFTS